MGAVRALLFVVVIAVFTAAVHYWFFVRLVRDPTWPPPFGTALTILLVVLALAIPASFLGIFVMPRDLAKPLMWVAYVWMGMVFLIALFLLPGELVRLGIGQFAPPSEERRLFMARMIAGVAAIGGAGLSALAVREGLREVAVERVRVPLRGLDEALRGFRIVQLTDVHVGPTIGAEFIRELVDKTNALEPDLVAITGDLVDGSVAQLGPLVTALSELRARHGVFFVTGNHEYYSNAPEWTTFLPSLGVRVLRNEHVVIEHDGAEIVIAGVDDWTAHQFGHGHGADLEAALPDRDPDRSVVLLAHQPRQFAEAAERGVSLQISGHTHGGQIFPFNYVVGAVEPYLLGLHERGDSKLYVSKGTGYWGPPMRLAVPAEITELSLEPV